MKTPLTLGLLHLVTVSDLPSGSCSPTPLSFLRFTEDLRLWSSFPLATIFPGQFQCQCLWPHLTNCIHSSPVSLMPETSTIFQTPPGLHQHPLISLLWIHKLLAVPSPHSSLNPLFPALHLLGHMKNTSAFYLPFYLCPSPLCFLFLTCICLSPRSSWKYHLSPVVPRSSGARAEERMS